MAAFILTDVQKVSLAVAAPLDGAGNPASLESVTWASSNEAVLTVVASADGFSAVATAVGPLGTAQITATADAEFGAGVTNLTAIGDVEVIASQAVSFGLSFGVAEPK